MKTREQIEERLAEYEAAGNRVPDQIASRVLRWVLGEPSQEAGAESCYEPGETRGCNCGADAWNDTPKLAEDGTIPHAMNCPAPATEKRQGER